MWSLTYFSVTSEIGTIILSFLQNEDPEAQEGSETWAHSWQATDKICTQAILNTVMVGGQDWRQRAQRRGASAARCVVDGLCVNVQMHRTGRAHKMCMSNGQRDAQGIGVSAFCGMWSP